MGGSVKWLCGGPGAGYLYVRPELAPTLSPAVTGWAAHARPFQFEVGDMEYAEPCERFQTGTPNVPAWYAARAGYEIVKQIGAGEIRRRSLELTARLIGHALERGYTVNTPLADDERGGTVTIDVPDAERVARALIDSGVIVDHRPGAGIRIAPHFYTTYAEIDDAIQTIESLVDKVKA